MNGGIHGHTEMNRWASSQVDVGRVPSQQMSRHSERPVSRLCWAVERMCRRVAGRSH